MGHLNNDDSIYTNIDKENSPHQILYNVFGLKKEHSFQGVELEITKGSICTWNCRFCYQKKYEKEEQNWEKYLRLDRGLEMFQKLNQAGFRSVYFLGGEPTLNPDFLGLLKMAKEYQFHTLLFTNASNLKTEYLSELVENLDILGIHVDTLNFQRFYTIYQFIQNRKRARKLFDSGFKNMEKLLVSGFDKNKIVTFIPLSLFHRLEDIEEVTKWAIQIKGLSLVIFAPEADSVIPDEKKEIYQKFVNDAVQARKKIDSTREWNEKFISNFHKEYNERVIYITINGYYKNSFNTPLEKSVGKIFDESVDNFLKNIKNHKVELTYYDGVKPFI